MTEIAILSGKGGTGKTSLTAAFATLTGKNVVADCDVETSNLPMLLQPEDYLEESYTGGYTAVINYDKCANCGICMKYCKFGAMSVRKGHVYISETACEGCMLCSRLCPSQSIQMIANDKSRWYAGNYRNGKLIHARLAPGEENSGKLVNIVRQQAKEIAGETGWDTILIDGPPGTGCPVISSLTGVHKALLVTEPTLSGFRDMQRLLQLMTGFQVVPYVIINRYDLNPELADRISGWCNEQRIMVAGKIRFDPVMVEAMLHGKSIVEWVPGSDTALEIKKIWTKIITNNEQNSGN